MTTHTVLGSTAWRCWACWGTFAGRLAVVGLFGVLSAGCDKLMQQPKCHTLDSCGGPVPVGTWILTPGHGSCSEDIYVAPTDPRLPMGTAPVARMPVLEPALYDWCDQLLTQVYNDKTGILVAAANFYTPDIQVGGASIRFNPDGTYSAGITRTGSYRLEFPAICMREFGATNGNPAFDYNNAMPVGAPVGLCKQLELPLGQMGLGPGSFRNTACDVDPDDAGGCVCTFDATETGGGAGTYLTQATSPALAGDVIVALPGKDFPQKISYCNSNNQLQLTGADGEYLFGTLGLRTLDLVPSQ